MSTSFLFGVSINAPPFSFFTSSNNSWERAHVVHLQGGLSLKSESKEEEQKGATSRKCESKWFSPLFSSSDIYTATNNRYKSLLGMKMIHVNVSTWKFWFDPSRLERNFILNEGGGLCRLFRLWVHVHANQVVLVVEKLLHVACLQWIKARGKDSRPSLEPTQLSWWYCWGCSLITENDNKKTETKPKYCCKNTVTVDDDDDDVMCSNWKNN